MLGMSDQSALKSQPEIVKCLFDGNSFSLAVVIAFNLNMRLVQACVCVLGLGPAAVTKHRNNLRLVLRAVKANQDPSLQIRTVLCSLHLDGEATVEPHQTRFCSINQPQKNTRWWNYNCTQNLQLPGCRKYLDQFRCRGVEHCCITVPLPQKSPTESGPICSSHWQQKHRLVLVAVMSVSSILLFMVTAVCHITEALQVRSCAVLKTHSIRWLLSDTCKHY